METKIQRKFQSLNNFSSEYFENQNFVEKTLNLKFYFLINKN